MCVAGIHSCVSVTRSTISQVTIASASHASGSSFAVGGMFYSVSGARQYRTKPVFSLHLLHSHLTHALVIDIYSTTKNHTKSISRLFFIFRLNTRHTIGPFKFDRIIYNQIIPSQHSRFPFSLFSYRQLTIKVLLNLLNCSICIFN